MIYYWKDQFGNRRKFLSCSLFDSKNDIVKSLILKKDIELMTIFPRNVRWSANLAFNNYIPVENAPFIPLTLLGNILPDIISKEISSVQPSLPEAEYTRVVYGEIL